MKNVKKIIGGIMLLILAAAGYGWYLYNEQPADIRKQTPVKELTATHIIHAFKENEIEANRQYVDKILIVSGRVTNIQFDSAGKATVFLDTGDPLSSVTCSFYNDETGAVKKITAGTAVRIKGICTGMLMDVVLNKCSIVK